MFFNYNNGITATANSVKFSDSKIISMTNLQIVNGGQTTGSIFAASKDSWKNPSTGEGIDLDAVSVQMKLSIVSPEKAEEVVEAIKA